MLSSALPSPGQNALGTDVPGQMSILLACSKSHVLRGSLIKNGHHVETCDLQPAEHTGIHHQKDVFKVISSRFDLMIAFPPCTYLITAQQFMCNHYNGRRLAQIRAIHFVQDLFDSPIKRIAIENPTGILSRAWRQPSQIIYPYFFGDPYRKCINLWLKNVPGVMSTLYSPSRRSINTHVNGRMDKHQKSNIKSSWNYYPLMCQAIADQWAAPIGLSYGCVAHRYE